MRVLPCIGLDRSRHTAVRVAFTQHRVDGTAKHLCVARLDALLFRIGRFFRVVRYVIALRLQFSDRCRQLRYRRADIGQLDDVRPGRLRQRAQLRQCISDLLFIRQPVRKIRNNATGQRDIPCLNRHTRGTTKGLHNGQE